MEESAGLFTGYLSGEADLDVFLLGDLDKRLCGDRECRRGNGDLQYRNFNIT